MTSEGRENRHNSLPSYRCPQCGAKRVLYATDRTNWAHHRLIPMRELMDEDYPACVVECPKCHALLTLLQDMVILDLQELNTA